MARRCTERVAREQRPAAATSQDLRQQEEKRPRGTARPQVESPLYETSPQASQHHTTVPRTRAAKRKLREHEEAGLEIERPTLNKKSKAVESPRANAANLEPIYYTSKEIERIDVWRRSGIWPTEYFEPDEDTRVHLRELSEKRSLDGSARVDTMERPNQLYRNGVPLARKRSSNSLRQQSDQMSTASDQKSRTKKSSTYLTPRYETLLNTEAVYMHDAKIGPSKRSLDLCRKLLAKNQRTPKDSLFSDQLFSATCERVRNANESKVIDKIARLIVPSVEELADRGSEHLEHMVECHNAGWNNSNPIKGPRPQPDYCVGFGRSAWTESQLQRLQPFVGELDETSAFMATYFMYFPTFMCEVKCGAQALDIADRQNAHSAAIAVRGIVELYKLVKRETELHQEILAYSISHSDCDVRIYGYYPIIETGSAKIPVYRHKIHAFDFTVLDGKERWTSAQFVMNLYDLWLPQLFQMLCSAVDQIPSGVSFELSEPSVVERSTGLSQEVQDYTLARLEPEDLQETQGISEEGAERQVTTPDTSISKSAKPTKRLAGSPGLRPKRGPKK